MTENTETVLMRSGLTILQYYTANILFYHIPVSFLTAKVQWISEAAMRWNMGIPAVFQLWGLEILFALKAFAF